jgi:hypothetical protein
MYRSGLQKDAGDKEILMDGSRKLKQDVASVFSARAEVDPR